MRPLFGEVLDSAECVACVVEWAEYSSRLDIRFCLAQVPFEFSIEVTLGYGEWLKQDAFAPELGGEEVTNPDPGSFAQLLGYDHLELRSHRGCDAVRHIFRF